MVWKQPAQGKDSIVQKTFSLHQNVQCLNGKITELEVLLQSDLKYDVLCFTEHWKNDQKLGCANIAEFKLVSAFYKNISEHWGWGILFMILFCSLSYDRAIV